jgi:hypothetical protein
MPNPIVVTGILTDAQTVVLDKALPFESGRVRVVVEPILSNSRSYSEVLTAIRRRQDQRGFVAPSRKEVDDFLEGERASWE